MSPNFSVRASLAAALVTVERGAFGGCSDAAPVVLGGAALVESVGVGARERESTTMEVARREELGGASSIVVKALRVAARALLVVVLLTWLASSDADQLGC